MREFNKRHQRDQQRSDLKRSIRGPVLTSAIVAGLLFGVMGSWAALVPIGSAALAAGEISPEGHRKTVQHLEGGIVRDIRVKDGDQVRKGDVLVVLEDTMALAAYRVQESRQLVLSAMEARLMAETSGALSPNWGLVPQVEGSDAAIEDQMRIFKAGIESVRDQGEILNKRVSQLNEEISGLESQIDSNKKQLAYLDDEIKMMKILTDKGLSRKPRLLELQRNEAGVQGELAQNRSAIARANQAIGETRIQILSLETTRRDEAANRLGDVRAQLADIEERMASTRDVLSRTVVMAPHDGTVIGLKMKTAGGVLRPGEPIMDIVPDSDLMLVDARVAPTDIDVVSEGLDAEVTLTAFPQRNLPKLKGVIRYVSADRLMDEQTGEMYFLARIEIDPDTLEQVGIADDLVPGMPADAMIFTGARPFLDYLMKPLMDSINKSFRES